MAQLPYLPEEVLQNIMWQLKLSLGFDYHVKEENYVSRKTLVSCLLSSRTFYRLAKPVLYHTINMDCLRDIVPYFSQHPGLSDLVREISVTDCDNCDCCDGADSGEDTNTELAWPSCTPAAKFVLGYCTRIHTLDLETVGQAPRVFPQVMLDECIALALARPGDTSVPLASLRKLILGRFAEYDPVWAGRCDDWVCTSLRLPQIESLNMCEIGPETRFPEIPSSSLKSLTTTMMEGVLLQKLENRLKACPVLERLNMTVWSGEEDDEFHPENNWTDIGRVLSLYGSKLRKISFDSRGDGLGLASQDNVINLASLRHLKTLTLPIEAVLHGSVGDYDVPATEHELAAPGYAAAHDDIEGLEDEDDFRTLHPPEQGVNTPTTPLTQILPTSLRYLRIMDDFHLFSDAVRLDLELRDLMLSPDFSELRTIRVRRKTPFSKHVENLGWHAKRREKYWQVLVRH
jgi:hypothetical protein